MISLLNLDFRNAHPFLFFRDNGVKNPEIKNMVDITKISRIKKRRPGKSLVEGSKTIHQEAVKPLFSYTSPACNKTTRKIIYVLRLSRK
jgi:hypothetical protein